MLAAAGLGAVLGAAAWLSDQLGWPLGLVIPANTIGVWLGVAFAAGATGGSFALGTLRGLVALLAGVAAYYLLIGLLGQGIRAVGATHAAMVWGAVAIVAGPVFGAAGAAWRHARGWPRALAIGLLGASLVAEGVAFGGTRLPVWAGAAEDPAVLLLGAEALVGLALPAVLLERGERVRGYVSLVLLGALALVAIGPVSDLVRGIADRF